MWNSVKAEVLVLTRRPATWVIFALWLVLSSIFGYGWAYVSYLNDPQNSRRPLSEMLPHYVIGNRLEGYPFFGGVLVLILGVLIVGSEYNWGTFKTLFTQGPGRLRVLAAKVLALEVVLLGFVFGSIAIGGLWSSLIAVNEHASLAWPSVSTIVRGVGAAWLIASVWAMFGLFLAVLSRGTSVAIGFGILYGLVIEGLLSAVASDVSFLHPVVKVFLRANGYSLIKPLIDAAQVTRNGPGAFDGPFVAPAVALLALGVYLAAFLVVAGTIVRRRDVA